MGSIETGKIADLVLWEPSMFGVKPEMIIKGGFICASKMGDANASIPTPQPVIYTDMFDANGLALKCCCMDFVSKVASKQNIANGLNVQKVLPVSNCRNIGKKDMKFNDNTADIQVDVETYTVTANGKKISCESVDSLLLTQRYYLF